MWSANPFLRDAKSFLTGLRPTAGTPLVPRRRVVLDPTRLPFEEADGRAPASRSFSVMGLCSVSSAPPTRGAGDSRFQSPMHLPSPPRTDPPRRIRKNLRTSSASLVPTTPDSPLHCFPPRTVSLRTFPGSSDLLDSVDQDPMEDSVASSIRLDVRLDLDDSARIYAARAVGEAGACKLSSLDDPRARAPSSLSTACDTRAPSAMSLGLGPLSRFDTGTGSSSARSLGSVASELTGVGSHHDVPEAAPSVPSTAVSSPRPCAGCRPETSAPSDGAPAAAECAKEASCEDQALGSSLSEKALLQARPELDYWDSLSHAGEHSLKTPLFNSAPTSPKRATWDSESADAGEDLHNKSADLGPGAGVVRGAEGKIVWQRGELVGRGTLGHVWKALNRKTGQLMAVKEVVLDAKDKDDDKFRQSLQNEIDLCKDINHPNIVSYLGHDSVATRLYIYLEFMPGGSIAQVLSQFGPLDEPLIARYTANLLKGLVYLHTRDPPILHRDIKGANILVGMDRTVKLSDFGCSKRSIGTANHTLRGSVPWMAPEVMRQSGYGRKADIWSIGCVLIEMSTAEPPWGAFDNCLAAMVRIAMSEETPPLPGHMGELCCDFVVSCTRRKPEERPDATTLLGHPFVAGFLDPSATDESWDSCN